MLSTDDISGWTKANQIANKVGAAPILGSIVGALRLTVAAVVLVVAAVFTLMAAVAMATGTLFKADAWKKEVLYRSEEDTIDDSDKPGSINVMKGALEHMVVGAAETIPIVGSVVHNKLRGEDESYTWYYDNEFGCLDNPTDI
ncbi:MAG: hypothetical protein K1000chlam4_00886 [Chlamydiae bacterium]|nr:hypothetical protein [Chlamydiota bacterium]